MEERRVGVWLVVHAQARAADVVAVTDCECITLDRDSFDRLLGPLESLNGQESVFDNNKNSGKHERDANVASVDVANCVCFNLRVCFQWFVRAALYVFLRWVCSQLT